MIAKAIWLGAVSAALAACAALGEQGALSASGARAETREAGGRAVGHAAAIEVGGAVRIRLEASGLAPGIYGAHVHAVGRCDSPGFESAGPHWNPTGREHGSQNPRGRHLGDLPNLTAEAGGSGTLEFDINGASLRDGGWAMLDGDGAALVIHAQADDQRTDPSGNSGARIACGVFVPA